MKTLVRSLLALVLVGIVAAPASAQSVSITTLGVANTQNFDTLSATTGTSSVTPSGWTFLETGTGANATYTVGTGSSTTGDTYSFGTAAATDRAFGQLRSGSVTTTLGGSFTNNAGAAITQLAITYNGEEWRLGATGRSDHMDFQYSVDATSLSTGTWADLDTLDFDSPFTTTTGALDGNAAANRTARSGTISTSLAVGATIWIRWTDVDVTGADDGLAIDDFSVTATGVTGPVCGNGTVETGESCDGGACCTSTCTYQPELTTCGNAAADTCDLQDSCNATGTCVDRVVGSGLVTCRASRDLCDAAEVCDGTDAACPADVRVAANTQCRASSGQACDVPDICDGLHDACTDLFAPSTTSCAAGTAPCDLGASCSGTSAACPAHTLAGNGTNCDDGLACNGASTCQTGVCTAGAAPTCDDANRCTMDVCVDPSGACTHGAIAGCCSSAMDCNDSNLCTTDACDGTGACSHTTIANCCVNDAGCSDGDVCTSDSCPTAGGACSFAPITGCCHSATDCNDGVSCTTDACDAGTNRCTHTAVPSCCTTATDCNDSNACTTDTCAVGGTCTNAAISGCCLTDGDCGDADTCTTDTCNTTTHVCGHASITNCCHAGDSCDDGDFCTDDSCGATSRCTHAAHSCDDSDVCTTDSCSAGACHHTQSCTDAGTDAGADAGTDAGIDAGIDGGADAGVDAAVTIDAGVDGAVVIDAGGSDAAVDAGHDAGHDGGARDGATSPDAGASTPPSSSCACRTSGAPGSSPLGVILGGLALALVVARRRRR